MKHLLQSSFRWAMLMCALALAVPLAHAQTATLQGRIYDSRTNETLPNANVVVKELNRGTVTDLEGRFTISGLPYGTYTLESSFVGYKRFSRTVEVNSSTMTFDIALEPATLGLDELVVTGYGVQTKREVTGAMSQIKSQQIEDLPVQTFDQVLQGRAAGVQVISSSGQPGAGMSVRIRGDGSINASARPLYIVDGVQVGGTNAMSTQADANPLSSINPNDILSIEILKDAAASSIYGAQAANGVVLITTKRGQSGGTRIMVGTQIGFVEPIAKYDLLDGPTFVEIMIEAYENQARVLGQNVTDARNTAISTFGDHSTVNSYDWQDAIYRVGNSQQYDITLSGGTNITRYYSSLSYESQEGQLKRSDFKRMTFRTNIDHQVNSRLSVESRLNLSSTRQFGAISNGNFTNGPFYSAVNTRPTEPIYNEDGSYNHAVSIGYNIVEGLMLEDRNATQNQVIGNGAVNYKINSNLIFRAFGGFEYRQVRDSNYRPPEIPSFAATGGSKFEANRELLNYNINSTLTFNKSFSNKHSINGLAGLEYKHETQEMFATTGTGFPSGLFTTLDLAAVPASATGSYTEYKTASAFAQFKYDFRERYLFSGTLRYDGSSRFGADNRYGLFYAVSGAWNVAREDFLSHVNWLTDLKFRASYGITGNSNISNYASRSLFGAGGTYVNSPGLRPSQLGNSRLTWEEAETIDLGVDFSLWSGRLTGAVDVFRRDNKRLLLARSLPNDSGFGSINENAGKVRNQGLEIELSSVNVDRGGFVWTSGFNITFIRDELLALNEGVDRIGNSFIVGESLYFYWGKKWAGVNPADGRAMWYDANNNITYAPVAADDQIIGVALPDYYGGFSNTFSYKGFTTDILFQYNIGQDTYNQHYAASMWDPSRLRGLDAKILDRWTAPGQVTDMPKVYRSLAEPGMQAHNITSSRFLEDASYIRLKNMTISYNVPSNILRNSGIHGVKIFMSGMNLITFTDYSGIDPEIVTTQAAIYPQSRQYRGGVQLTF